MAKTKAWYGKCSKQELITFIKDRTGEDVGPKQAKKALVARLYEIDRDPGVFDFLGLTQELKDLIYEELFADATKTGRATQIAIMRTCKQLYKDVSPMFNKDSHVGLKIKHDHSFHATLRFPVCGRNHDLQMVYFRPTSQAFGIGSASPSTKQAPGAPFAPPTHRPLISRPFRRFRRVQNVTVTIGYSRSMYCWPFLALGLKEIVDFWPTLLEGCEDLRKLKVIVDDKRGDKDENRELLLEMLAPLQETWNQGKLEIEGLGPRTRKAFMAS
ncbi:hypothetical protein PRZ48_011024 [Zasmidium cellare]|uniref:Uncharacterized protein n=1 Tax=Zasmidium cellare TaxID=395010 RepID=A0ABR0EAU8_ZASCE|nr:hypothetical protein PRZ48_011024 [Zasmidium cellare]